MENVLSVASYIYNRYQETYHHRIDEMKLHKLLYFAQRESLIQSNEPLFNAVFHGWKYGPVVKEIRDAYRNHCLLSSPTRDIDPRIQPIMDSIFKNYAGKDSWSLSRLTHGEISWKNSRIGIPQAANSDNIMKDEDIMQDAERIRQRRELLSQHGLL